MIDTGCQRMRTGKLSLGEILFIMALFLSSSYKDFKHFRFHGVLRESRDRLGELPNHGRFVTLMPGSPAPFRVLPRCFRGEKTGI